MEKYNPKKIDGKHYVELLSYGEVNPISLALQEAQKHFKQEKDLALEIGVLRGHNAYNINRFLHPKLLVLVDPWDGSTETHPNNWADTYFRIQGHKNIIVVKTTSEVASQILNLTFDYIYIDGDHIGGDLSPGTEEEGIRKDIKLWWPRVNPGGILAGHDYNYDNIKLEVDTVFGDAANHTPILPGGGAEWWVYKET